MGNIHHRGCFKEIAVEFITLFKQDNFSGLSWCDKIGQNIGKCGGLTRYIMKSYDLKT